MDIIALLKEEHKAFAHLLNQLAHTENEDSKTRIKLFEQLEEELIMHTGYEEKLFYPTLKNNPKTHTIVLEAFQEHHVIGHILADISHVSFEHDVWKAKLTVLTENLKHHIMEEEQDLFPKVRQLLSPAELEQMGREHQAFKAQLRQKRQKKFTH